MATSFVQVKGKPGFHGEVDVPKWERENRCKEPDHQKEGKQDQTASFWVGLVVALFLWVQLLLRWTRAGVIALQPVTLPDYILILGLFVAVPLVVIALFMAMAAYVALNRAKSIE